MPTVNTSCIQARYDEQLARLYYLVNYDPDSVLSYALVGTNLNDVGVIVVQTVASLPYLYYGSSLLPSGMVYFVQSLGILVISSNNTWITLDGTVVRTDTDYNRTVWAWGAGLSGTLGNNAATSSSSPISVVGGFTDWCQVSAGVERSGGLRQNGTIWTWGLGSQGVLGNNCTTDRSSPVSVVGGFTDWFQVSAGGGFFVGLRSNGTAWAWGTNSVGQLGDNTTVSKSSPVSVVGDFTDWCQISAGGTSAVGAFAFSLGVRQNGTIWGWGAGTGGRLGNNCTSDRSSPVSITASTWCYVSAGEAHALAVRQNGTAWAWGQNNTGQLGTNNTTSVSAPDAVVGGITDWCQVSAGNNFSLALRQNGTTWAWGLNNSGLLGDNTSANKSSPVSVVGGFTDWCQVSAGNHSLGLRGSGSLWAWGYNAQGQLGDNTTVSKCSPVCVAGSINNWFQVSAGMRNGGCNNSLGVTFD